MVLRNFSLFFLLPTVVLFPSLASAEEIHPRAYLVTKGDSAAMIVGETHTHTPLEFDSYYDRVVKPGFQAAQIALLEGDFGTETPMNEGLSRYSPCEHDDQHGGRLNDKLNPRLAELNNIMSHSNLTYPGLDTPDLFPERLLTSFLEGFYVGEVLPKIRAAQKNPVDDQGVSLRLRLEAVKADHRYPKINALDTLSESRERFCSAPAEYRQDYLVNIVDAIIGGVHMLDDVRKTGVAFNYEPLVQSMYTHTLDCVDATSPCTYASQRGNDSKVEYYGLVCPNNKVFFTLGLQDRTRTWLPKIITAMNNNQRTFVAVGALHLPDLRYDNEDYPGLLTLLRKAGYKVTPIRGEQDIQETLLKLSWWDRFVYKF